MKVAVQSKVSIFIKCLLVSMLLLVQIPSAYAQGIAINESGNPRDASSLLDVSSTAKGILIPRMTFAQRNAIVGPATGLLIFQTDNTPGFYYNAGTPVASNWQIIGNNAGVFSQWAYSANNIYYNTGSVGIGTSTPAALLEVSGPAIIQGVNIGKSSSPFASNLLFGAQALAHVTDGENNTAIGHWALNLNNGIENTAVGVQTLQNNLDGSYNVAVGAFTLSSNTGGACNTAAGAYSLMTNTLGYGNTAFGYLALYANNEGGYNTACGTGTLKQNFDGSYNTAAGYSALSGNISGTHNTATGYQALYSNTNGTHNTANGVNALYSNTGGSLNVAAGFRALYKNSSGDDNVAVGYNALSENLTGDFNTAVGSFALQDNQTGEYNTASGNMALWFNTSGMCNTATGASALSLNTSGNYNTATGNYALKANTTGSSNTASGANALFSNTTGYSNIAVGAGALYQNTFQPNLVAVGDSALFNNGFDTTEPDHGKYNTAIGSKAMLSNISGSWNTALGYQTLYLNNDGLENTALGYKALNSNLSGSWNTAAGGATLLNNSTGYGNSAFGHASLLMNTTGSTNAAIGSGALQSNTIGYSNVAVGFRALMSNTERSNLVAIGDSALFNNGTNAVYEWHGGGNTAVGSKAMLTNNIGCANTALGMQASMYNTSGYDNTALGAYSQRQNVEGYANTSVGSMALYYNQYGCENTAVGFNALFNAQSNWNTGVGVNALSASGGGNSALGWGAGENAGYVIFGTFLGAGADAYLNYDLFDVSALGYGAEVSTDHSVRIGNYWVTSIGGWAGWTNLSDTRYQTKVREDVAGLDFIMKLRPVTYHLDVNKLKSDRGYTDVFPDTLDPSGKLTRLSQKASADKAEIVYTGFIAQDVEASAKEIGFDFSGVDAPDDQNGIYGLRYAEFVVPIVKAIQEQQQQIENLEPANVESLMEDLEDLRAENMEIRAQLSDLFTMIGSMGETIQRCCNKNLKENSSPGNETPVIPEKAMLEQNAPNPFNQRTVIRYYLPAGSGKASIIITNMIGVKMNEFDLVSEGYGQVTVHAGSLSPGTYVYSLIIKGKQADSKRMILL